MKQRTQTQCTFLQPNISPCCISISLSSAAPALHPQVRLIIPSPASLSWGACCQFIRLFLLISYFPQCKHPSPLSAAALEGSEHSGVKQADVEPTTDREKRLCDGVMISFKKKEKKQYTVHTVCLCVFPVFQSITSGFLCLRLLNDGIFLYT